MKKAKVVKVAQGEIIFDNGKNIIFDITECQTIED